MNQETRQERREKKLKKKRERIPQHGKNLAKMYMDAILERVKRLADEIDGWLSDAEGQLLYKLAKGVR